MKKFVRSSLCTVLVVVMVLGCTFSAMAKPMDPVGRWSEGDVRQVNQLIKSKETIETDLSSGESETVEFDEYTYDKEGRLLSQIIYADSAKTMAFGGVSIKYTNDGKTVTIDLMNAKGLPERSFEYTYPTAVDPLKNFDEQPYSKLVYIERGTTGIIHGKFVTEYSSDFKEETETYYRYNNAKEEYYLEETTITKYTKSAFEKDAQELSKTDFLYNNEGGEIRSGSKTEHEYNSYGDLTKQTDSKYDTSKKDFVAEVTYEHEYTYSGTKMTQDISTRTDIKGNYSNKQKIVYTYDKNSVEELGYTWLEGEYKENAVKHVTAYDENGNETKYETFLKEGDQWLLSGMTEHTYDKQNRELSKKTEGYDYKNGGDVTSGEIETYVYDEYGHEKEYYYTEWDKFEKKYLEGYKTTYKITYVEGVPTTSPTTVDAPTANTGLVYDNSEKTGVSEATGYTVTDGKKTAAGEYTATATLASGYIWSDGTTAAKEIKWNIAKATPYIKTNPEPTDIVYGKKLSDSTLVGGYVQISSTNTTQVGGSFEWKLGDTIPALSDSETTEYDVTFTPADTNNYNTVSCKVKIKVTHTHNPVLVNGQAATKTAAGWKDYYKCDCDALFEDENGTTPIENLEVWKAKNGNGYIAMLGEETESPEAGDNSDTILWVMLLALSSMGLCACLVLGKKIKNEQ